MIPLTISCQYARKHRLRLLLTVTGVGVGVAMFVGTHAAGESVLAGLSTTIDRIAGKTQLQITAGEAGFPEDVLERVQSVRQVEVAAPVIEAVVQSGIEGEGNLLVIGVDMTGDRSLREYDIEAGEEDIVDDPLVFLAQPDSLIVTRDFATRNRVETGSKLTMQTMVGERKFTVRGIMRPGGLSAAFGGNLAVMDIYAAQQVFGRGRRFDRIDVRLKDDSSLEDGKAILRQLLGPGFQVDLPATRGHQFDSLLHVYFFMVNVTSLFALLIGLFIIYNTFAVAVTERRPEIGVLRALGAMRREVFVLFLIEGMLLGIVGSVLGIVLGKLIAQVIAGYIGNVMLAHYGISSSGQSASLNARLIAAGMIIGTAASTVAAALPARSAAHIDPIRALQRGHQGLLWAGESRLRRRIAYVFAALALACMALGRSRLAFYAGYVSFLSAALLLAPTAGLWLCRLLRPALIRMRPIEGPLAADSLLQAPRRTSATMAALMLSTGLVVSLTGFSRGAFRSVLDWVDSFLNSDVLVLASENGTNRSFHFPNTMTAALGSLQGVDEIQRMRSNHVVIKDASVLLVAIDMEKAATRSSRVIAGDRKRMYHLAAEGKGVIISENCGLLQNIARGDMVDIPSPTGLLHLPVVGIVTDYLNQSGTIFIDYDTVYLRYWADPTVDIYKLYVSKGTSPDELKQRIQATFSKQMRLFVGVNREVKARIISNTRQWLGLSYIQIAVAMVVAVLGIANTLFVSITDRRRDLATLRVVGAQRSTVRAAVWLEGVTIAFIGVVLGIAFGAIDLSYELEVVRRDYAGLTLDYIFPTSLVPVLGATMVLAAFVSALAASEAAVRNSLIEALGYE
jgi:putative ABC transport system permease protein